MARFTILGGHGFVGRNLAQALDQAGHPVRVVGRDLPARGEALGHVIYAIGLTANFRQRLADTVRAHVCVLADALEHYRFESFLYLSSTRLYAGASSTGETAALAAQPELADHVYNLSKMTGESLCLAQSERAVRVVRLSNVIGPGDGAVNFLPSLIDEARRTGRVVIRTAPKSEKDYVDIRDACDVIGRIALAGPERLYNVASGVNTSNETIAEALRARLGATVSFAADAPAVRFPRIDVSRIVRDFAFLPSSFATSFAAIAEGHKE